MSTEKLMRSTYWPITVICAALIDISCYLWMAQPCSLATVYTYIFGALFGSISLMYHVYNIVWIMLVYGHNQHMILAIALQCSVAIGVIGFMRSYVVLFHPLVVYVVTCIFAVFSVLLTAFFSGVDMWTYDIIIGNLVVSVILMYKYRKASKAIA